LKYYIVLYKKRGDKAFIKNDVQRKYSREAYKPHDDKILEKEYKKLLEDLQWTKAENEYLKKSFAKF